MTSKLHIPGQPGLTATACGRQLNNHRTQHAQNASNAVAATSATEYLSALARGRACRHCGRAAGLLPPLVRRTAEQSADNDGDDSDE